MAEILHEPIDGVRDLRRLVRAPVLGIIPLVALPGAPSPVVERPARTRGRQLINVLLLGVVLAGLAGAVVWAWPSIASLLGRFGAVG